MIDINTLRFAVQLNKLDNSQLPASPLVVEDLLDRIEKAAKEHAALRAELSTEKGWIEDYKKQIVSLQNRLEASEHECTEQARLNGMGASREAALLAKLEAAEKSDAESLTMYRKARDERDALRAALQHEADCVEAAKAELKALRAKITEMEQQEPVAWLDD